MRFTESMPRKGVEHVLILANVAGRIGERERAARVHGGGVAIVPGFSDE
jgi:hypothetical protein